MHFLVIVVFTLQAVDYPSVDFTREVLEEARTWATYKNRVIKEIYRKKLDKRPVQPRR